MACKLAGWLELPMLLYNTLLPLARQLWPGTSYMLSLCVASANEDSVYSFSRVTVVLHERGSV